MPLNFVFCAGSDVTSCNHFGAKKGLYMMECAIFGIMNFLEKPNWVGRVALSDHAVSSWIFKCL